MKTVTSKGFTAWVDRHVVAPGHNGAPLMVSVYGQLTHVRAITAALVLKENRKGYYSSVRMGDSGISLDEEASYSVITQRSEKRAFGIPTRSTLIHERCTIKRLGEPFFYVLSPGKLDLLDDKILELVRLSSHLGISQDDKDWLWEDREKEVKYENKDSKWDSTGKLITEIGGYNCYAYRINAQTELVAQLWREHFGKCITPTVWRDAGALRNVRDDPRFPQFHFEYDGHSTAKIFKGGKQLAEDQSYHGGIMKALEGAGRKAGLWVLPEEEAA